MWRARLAAFFGPAPARAVLRISASGADAPVRFDALLVCGPIRAHTDVRRVVGASAPANVEVPAGDLCAVVRQCGGAGRMLVEYELERGGRRRVYHRILGSAALLLHRGARTLSASLEPDPDPAG